MTTCHAAKKAYLALHPKSKFAKTDKVRLTSAASQGELMNSMELDPEGKTVEEHIQDALKKGDKKKAADLKKIANKGAIFTTSGRRYDSDE